MEGFVILLTLVAVSLVLAWTTAASRTKRTAEISTPTSDRACCEPTGKTPQKLAPRTVQLKGRRILIDGQPRQIFAGEIHYFRLKPEDWADRLDKLQANGMDTVATYIPWIWHEVQEDQSVDVTGRTHPQRNLVKFLDMCAERGLNVIARPGPFVMAELKNEGLPYRLYREPTNLRPVSWHGEPVKTATLDYLSPEFLAEAKAWYAGVLPCIAERLCWKGGPVIAVQLDNEIGMLSWAANTPDLTDHVCEDMRQWAIARYGEKEAERLVGASPNDAAAWAQALRFPKGDTLGMHDVLGLYNRDRFRRYVEALQHLSEENGVKDVPFLVNIHGTSGGRGRTFPIGISQLFESYRGKPGVTSGSDIYLGELTTANLPDLYALNAFMGAMHDADQPTTSLEFEAGDANYADDYGLLNSPQCTELKTRLCVAQGLRLLNYYLHAGGENPPLEGCADGLDRIAITGQRHGYAAPVGPEGQLNPTYFAQGRVVQALNGIEKLVADSDEEHDGFALGFVPDHYLTEYRYPASQERAEQIADMDRFRGTGARDGVVRNLLLAGFSFPAVDLQAGVPTMPCIVLSTGRTLRKEVQENVAEFVRIGGKLLLTGLLPDRDHDGAPCTVLADALGLKDAGRVFDGYTAKGLYWASVGARGWAAPRAEVRVGFAQLVANTDGSDLDHFMVEVGSGMPCAIQKKVGRGEIIFFGSDYNADFALFKESMARLGVKPRFQLDAQYPGVVVTSTVKKDTGERLIHLINVASYAVPLKLSLDGRPCFRGRTIQVPAQTGFILPAGVCVGKAMIVNSTAELVSVEENAVTVRPTQNSKDIVVLDTMYGVSCSAAVVNRTGTRVEVHLHAKDNHGRPSVIVVE
jgi:beta-galactosidase